MEKKSLKEQVRNFLDWLWHSESWLSYIVFIILIFVIVKFIFLPGMGLVLGTKLPLAIVESCSMYHEDNFMSDYNKWWAYWESNKKYAQFNITQEQFSDFKFKDGFNKGDILLIVKANPKNLKIGDVIIFSTPGRATPIIHRIVSIREENNKKIFSTIGDHNPSQLAAEKEIQESQLVGKAVLRIGPYMGWVKLIFFEASRSPNEKGFCKDNF